MEEPITKAPKEKDTQRLLPHAITAKEIVFLVIAVLSLSPLITPPVALLLGLLIAQFMGNPFLHLNHKATRLLLQISVVGLGFGMNAGSALKAGKEGLFFTIATIAGTLIAGALAGRLLKVNKVISYLITTGTAICGGSAIAAIAPVIKAGEKQVSVALGTIFILNAAALFFFPPIGHALNLSQTQFGVWSAIAIHDTSSVVGAASKYGAHALEVATTIKLARALWIVPIALLSAFLFKSKESKVRIPYFIGLFILAMIANTYVPVVQLYGHYIVSIAKAGLTLTLFLIGSGLSKDILQSVGFKPMLQGILLWLLISGTTLWTVIAWAK